MSASTSSRCPLPSTPATPTTSPRCTVNDTWSSTARTSSTTVSPRDVELDLVGDGRLAGVGLGQLAADHQLGELAGGHVLGQHRRDSATCPNDGDRVGDGEHLVELVADEEHRDALGGELAQRREQLVDLLRHEHRGRLVEDQDAGAAVEHLEDLDPLAIADAEVADQAPRAAR